MINADEVLYISAMSENQHAFAARSPNASAQGIGTNSSCEGLEVGRAIQ